MTPLNILFLSAHLPVLGLHGGGTRMFHNLRILAERHRIFLVSFIEQEEELDQVGEIEKLGVHVKTVLRRPLPARDLLLSKPREHWEYASRELKTAVLQAFEKTRFDVVQAEYLQMGQHVPLQGPAFKILTEHEVHFDNAWNEVRAESRVIPKFRKYMEWLSQYRYEIQTCRQFDRVVCMTEQDRSVLSSYLPPSKLKWIPIGVDSNYFQPRALPTESTSLPQLLFVGNYRHPPNCEAVQFMAQEILPRLQAYYPKIQMVVAGANTGFLSDLSLKDQQTIRLVGYQPDIRTVYNPADIFVAPLHSGNGMRVKLLEALSMGMAVVATRLAIAGFSAIPEKHLLLAETPEEFTAQLLRLLQDPALRIQLGANARNMIREQLDWKVLGSQFLDVVENRNV
ncbi:MAG: glycosyltransferase family 4 protein [Terriglobia bacterium]